MPPRSNRVVPTNDVRSPARSFAQSLDNFYSPARDTRSEQAFQRGIDAFSGILQQEANQIKETRNNDEMLQGVQDAMREQAGQELLGVRTGSIFRQNSRFYMAGLNETRGKAAAAKWKADTALAYEEWDGRHTDDDGSAFREWMNGRVADFMGTLGEDQYKLAGALPIINEVATNFAAHHTGFTSSRLENESYEAYDTIVTGVFDALANGEIDMDQAIERIAFEADEMYLTDGAAANDRVVTAAISYANIHNDPEAILALARAHDAGTLKLSVANQERLANAMDAVEADIERNAAKANARATAEEKARRTATLNAWGATLAEDPDAELPSFADVGDHQTYREMITLQDAMIKSAGVENPTVTNVQRMKLEVDLYSAATPGDRIRVLNEFVQENPYALSASDVAGYTKTILAKNDPGSIVNDPTIGKYRTAFGNTLAEFQLGDGFDINRSSYLKTQGQVHFDDYMLANAGNVDMNDSRAIRTLVDEAEEFAMEQLAFDFPEVLREKSQEGNLGPTLGVDQALQKYDEAATAAAKSAYETILNAGTFEAEANVVETQATDVAPEAAPEVSPETAAADAELLGVINSMTQDAELEPVVTPEPETPSTPTDAYGEPYDGIDPSIEEQPTPFEDSDSEEAYSPVRSGFYGELLHRFTDGKIEKGVGTLDSATELLVADPEFHSEVERVAEKLGVNKTLLLAVMDFETGGTFDPAEPNQAGSGGTGLIQFMPSTARALGTTTEELALMTRAEQMVYVEKYFDQFAGRIRNGSLSDVYMAVLWPRAIGKSDSYVLFRSGTKVYEQNRGLDRNGDGTVTKFEASAKVRDAFFRRGG